ncbi:MAG: hypothetical protein JST93_15710 [Acidobacteria bacterium]|nr:hypothetical protein [Acidobacteriota bacterium]
MDPFQGIQDQVLLQHLSNLFIADVNGGLTASQQSEVNGERDASEHMSGRQPLGLCRCDIPPQQLAQARGQALNQLEPYYRQMVPPNVCLLCQYQSPMQGEWRMVKGWSGGGTGIDQIWVKPPNWTPASGECPEEVRIVEAKGGPGSALSTDPTYIGDYGPDGFPLEQGCIQMSREWVYVACDRLANTAEPDAELSYVAAMVRSRLAGQIGCPLITGIVLKNGKPMTQAEMPADSQEHADSGGTFSYDPVLHTETLREQLLRQLGDPSTQPQDLVDSCQQALDALEESSQNNVRFQTYLAEFSNLVNNLGQIAEGQQNSPLLNHALNILQEFNKQVERRQALIDHKVEQYLKTYDPFKTLRDNPNWMAKALSECEKAANTQIYRNLNEVTGELMAANYMMQRPGFVMLKGWSGGGTGIDQVWLRSPANPDATLEQLLQAPPDDLEVIIVEAKGGSAKLNDMPVYVGAVLPNGQRLDGGCLQMDPNWVGLHAIGMVQEAQDNPLKAAAGQLILTGMQSGKPKVRGIGISNGAPMSTEDYEHLDVASASDVDGLPENVIKYGP